MFVLRAFTENNWHLVYYNPPSGSWKTVSLLYEDKEYRQVGPKRGHGRFKRPDIAFQYTVDTTTNPTFLIFEDKQSRTDWKTDLPSLLKGYFENSEDGIRRLPFDHRRKIGTPSWEELEESHQDRFWFKEKVNPNYLYGFAYGPIESGENLEEEVEWMESQFEAFNGDPPPLMFIAIVLNSQLEHQIIWRFSSTFPKTTKERIEEFLSQL